MDTQQKTILVIEDSSELRELLQAAFEKEGYTVISLADGETGYETTLEKKPDLILLDIILPKMDGLTFLQKIRSEDSVKDIPVIILSNLDDAEKVSEAMQSGVFNFLLKSDWEIKDVVAKVQRKLEEVDTGK